MLQIDANLCREMSKTNVHSAQSFDLKLQVFSLLGNAIVLYSIEALGSYSFYQQARSQLVIKWVTLRCVSKSASKIFGSLTNGHSDPQT